MKKINVLSTFNGMGCIWLALDKVGIEVNKRYSSEIDVYANIVNDKNYPDTIQLGDIRNIALKEIDNIDLLVGGSPCQSISNLGKKEGLDGKSGLFYEFLKLKNLLKPKFFILENVVGSKKATDEITKLMDIEPITINSNMFSAQNRKRMYWTNIPVLPFEDRLIKLQDILEDGIPKDSVVSEKRLKWLLSESGQNCIKKKYATIDGEKSQCLTARSDASWNSNYITRFGQLTRLTPIEYERLQTVPDNYTNHVKIGERYKMLGNGWTVDVIAHILKSIK